MCALFKCPLWKLSANKGLVKIVERDASLYFSFGEHRSSGLCVWTHRWPVMNHSRGDRIINKTANETLDSALFSSHDVSSPSLTDEWQGETGADKRNTARGYVYHLMQRTFLSYSPSSCKLSALVSMSFAIKHFVTPVELLTWLVRAKFSSRFQDLIVEKIEFRQRRMTWHVWNVTQVYWKILIWQIAAWNSNKGNL